MGDAASPTSLSPLLLITLIIRLFQISLHCSEEEKTSTRSDPGLKSELGYRNTNGPCNENAVNHSVHIVADRSAAGDSRHVDSNLQPAMFRGPPV